MDLRKIAFFGILSALISAVYGYSTGYAFSSLGGEFGSLYWFALFYFIPFLISICIFALLSYSVSSHHYQTACTVLVVATLLSLSAIVLITKDISVDFVLLFELALTLIALGIGTAYGKWLRVTKDT